MKHSGSSNAALATVVFALLATCQSAYAIQHVVEYVHPRGGSRGTTVDVKIHGRYLADPQDVIFHRPGIKCVNVKAPPPAKNNNVINNYFEAQFEIAADCPLGEHLLRVRTANFLAEPVTFWVTPYPTVAEAEKKLGDNDTIEKAQKIELNTTVSGEINTGEVMDHDLFKFEAKKGQRISIEAASARLANQHLNGDNDVMFQVLGPKGEIIAKCDDTAMFVQDPAVSFLAPADGTYVVDLSAQMYISQNRAYYVMHIGTFARPTGLLPLGGKAGEKLDVRVLGDPLGPVTESVTLPDKEGDFAYFPGRGGPTPMMLRVSPFPNTLEAEPNDNFTQARTVALPAALNGLIERDGDADLFKFTAEKGQVWRVRVFARGLGMPLDPRVTIRAIDKKGQPEERPLHDLDDATMAERHVWAAASRWQLKEMLDPSFVFRPANTGEYVLAITDTRGQGGPDFAYRIEIDVQRDGFHTFVVADRSEKRPREIAFTIPQGNRWTINVKVASILGTDYQGDLELYAEGLPKGVTMTAPIMTRQLREQRGSAIPVQFTAAADVPQHAGFFRILARSTDGKTKLETGSQQAFSYAERNQGYSWHHIIEDKFAYAVVAPAPFELEVEQPPSVLARNGEVAIKVKMKRLNGWDGKVELQTDWTSPGVERGVAQTINPGETETTLRLRAGAKAGLGTYQLAVTGSSCEGELISGAGCRLVSTKFINLTVAEPYVTATLKRASIERGHAGQMVAELVHNTPMPGKATATLVGLPFGVQLKQPYPEISSSDKEVVFNIEATGDALVGQYKEILCEIAITDNGQTFKQQTGSGILRVDPARGTGATK